MGVSLSGLDIELESSIDCQAAKGFLSRESTCDTLRERGVMVFPWLLCPELSFPWL